MLVAALRDSLARTTYPRKDESSRPAFVIASPYADLPLSLTPLSPAHVELALRLQYLAPACSDASFWATNKAKASPYPNAFNWADILQGLPEWLRYRGEKFITLTCIVFRSTLASNAASLRAERYPDTSLLTTLHQLDKEAYAEAIKHIGGLLKYWFGATAPAATDAVHVLQGAQKVASSGTRQNVATCVWVSSEHAHKATRLPAHKAAQQLVKQGVYSDWRVSGGN